MSSPAGVPEPGPHRGTMARALSGVILSLFVCPGLGHRLVGRPRAGWVFLGLFLISCVFLGCAVYVFVFDAVQKLGGMPADLNHLVSLITSGVKNSLAIMGFLGMLLTVYVLAPVELLLFEIWRALFPGPVDGKTKP